MSAKIEQNDRRMLWAPSQQVLNDANVTRFIAQIAVPEVGDFHTLYKWSVTQPEAFWEACVNFFDVKLSAAPQCTLRSAAAMKDSRWFPGAKLNFAENLLRNKGSKRAIVFRGEDQVSRSLSYEELFSEVRALAAGLRAAGVNKGDRVAALLPNMPEAIIGMLATSSLGAVWSSASPDFGVNGVFDRFGQIEPKILIASDGYFYKQKLYSNAEKVAELCERIPSIQNVVVVPYTSSVQLLSSVPKAVDYKSFCDDRAEVLEFTQVDFNDPLYIMFSSGTTGKPKCIVHGVGGTLLEHLKELVLHTDVKETDTIFYATTCGWMMWNWLASAVATGATLALYDGFPFLNDGSVLWDFAEQEKITIFGTSAGYISALQKNDVRPKETHDLSALRSVLSTGSVLVPESFDFVYEEIKADVCLSSISGGTDIVGCFALGSPTLPVYRGELQTRSLGYAVEVFNMQGEPVEREKGELVCTAPFPSMPIYFWNDPEGERFSKAYFERFDGVWHHGDFVELSEHGGVIFYGRSDATLNPGGVRIGTAEIYRELEKRQEIQQSVVVGQPFEDSERIVLFVKMTDGVELSPALIDQVKSDLRSNVSPRHVPAHIVAVPDIPVTRSGKISELTIKRLLMGQEPENVEALKNPESLEFFKGVHLP